MSFKSQKGYTGVDIAISVVVVFLFISLIAFLSYNFNSSAAEIKIKAEATEIAVEEIEKLKNELNFQEIENIMNDEYKKETIKTKFLKTVLVQDYANIKEGKTPGVVKKVTIQILYVFNGIPKTIELSTIVSKEI